MAWISRRRKLGILSVYASLAALWLRASTVQAELFVLFDATFTFTKKDADNSKPSPSHYYVRDKLMNADRPKDWANPIDYRNGTAHVRLEVLEKPPGNLDDTKNESQRKQRPPRPSDGGDANIPRRQEHQDGCRFLPFGAR